VQGDIVRGDGVPSPRRVFVAAFRVASVRESAVARIRSIRAGGGDQYRWAVRLLIQPYLYGTQVCMKKTLHIDENLLREAKSAAGARTDTDAVRLGLEALVRRGAYARLQALRGSEPRARETSRRRERPSSAKPSAA
jgi:Arc/MetJ family transcription regulator